ncbi:urease accessory protein UreD [Pseudomaricurvus alcaniphilus]|uniref:urease accessory protein UreD n=1 Tax=Pseudomaricurvus alcaniphilus TaxID=1166482 RepID=UPI00140A6C34|nr:urease accessory protein UreD [Pseudomaricurvus alcaniphilus]NHN36127.1 urease accessory protein UreD [Pseudomaricurvus alcaniphilus]
MTIYNALATADIASTWDASLELGFEQNSRGSRLKSKRHVGPLYVQKPFYPEGENVAHVYILHPPGGLVSGDRLDITVRAGSGSHALLTTPGAGRVYRARHDHTPQCQTITLDLQADAVVEWLPLETIVFNGARTRLQTRVNLQPGARYIGWEVTSLGLPASHSAFDSGEVQQSLTIAQADTPLLIERLRLQGEDQGLFSARAGMQGLPINGLFVAGPFSPTQAKDDLLGLLREQAEASDFSNCLAGVSLVNGFLVGRYLGACSEQGRNLFERWWSVVRPELLARAACRPRIWST